MIRKGPSGAAFGRQAGKAYPVPLRQPPPAALTQPHP